jgi:uncharacterized membrane protein YccC
VHRDLRDHFTRINDGRLRAASDALQAARNPEPGRDRARAGELRAQLAELDALLPRSARPAPAVNGSRPNPAPPQRVQPPLARRQGGRLTGSGADSHPPEGNRSPIAVLGG